MRDERGENNYKTDQCDVQVVGFTKHKDFVYAPSFCRLKTHRALAVIRGGLQDLEYQCHDLDFGSRQVTQISPEVNLYFLYTVLYLLLR